MNPARGPVGAWLLEVLLEELFPIIEYSPEKWHCESLTFQKWVKIKSFPQKWGRTEASNRGHPNKGLSLSQGRRFRFRRTYCQESGQLEETVENNGLLQVICTCPLWRQNQRSVTLDPISDTKKCQPQKKQSCETVALSWGLRNCNLGTWIQEEI